MASPAAIIERVREIHRSYQEQIDSKRAQQVPPSVTKLSAPPATSQDTRPNEFAEYYTPNSFVGQWLEKHPDTSLKDLSMGTSSAPLRTFLGLPTAPFPRPEAPAFSGLTHNSPPEVAQTTQAFASEDDGDGSANMSELVALGSAAEVTSWLKSVRELQVGGRNAASDWSAAEQRQVEAMVQEEMAKVQVASKMEEDRGYQRLLTLQTIAEQLGAISKRPSFEDLPDSVATIDDWLDDLKTKVDDWYLNRKETSTNDGGPKVEVKTAATKQKLNQISSGLASAAAHEGLLLTAQQLDQVLSAFYQQDQRKAPQRTDTDTSQGGSPIHQRAVARLSKQLMHSQAREDAVRRVMGARNKALGEEIARLGQMLEAVTEYGGSAEGVSASMASTTANQGPHRSLSRGMSLAGGLGGSNRGSTMNETGVTNLVQMMSEQNAASGDEYGMASILKNKRAVESLNSITLVVAEALSRKRMRALQGQIEKLRSALTVMKESYATASDRLRGLATENTRLNAELEDFGKTFQRWKEIKDGHDAERKRLAREGGTELGLQKEVINRLVQRSTTLFGQLLAAMAATGSAMVASSSASAHPNKYLSHHEPTYSNRRASLAAPVSPRHISRPSSPANRIIAIPSVASPSVSRSVGGKAASPNKRMSVLYPEGDVSSRRSSIGVGSEDPSRAMMRAPTQDGFPPAMRRSALAVREWVAFAISTYPSDAAKMLLGDLDSRALQYSQMWAGDGEAQQDTKPKPTSTVPEGNDAVVEALSHRLDQTVCEVRDKFREERFMRTTIKYFVQRVEEMCVGTYKEDPLLEGPEDAMGLGQGTPITGTRNPLDKLKPLASISHVKVFPPKAVTLPDTEYAYAWTDETDSLQRLFLSLKAILMHEVERTETTNAIVGALEKYTEEGPAFKPTALSKIALPPIKGEGGAKGGQRTSTSLPLGDPMGVLQKVKLINEKEANRLASKVRKM